MSTFTYPIAIYHLTDNDQGKQTTVFSFLLAENKGKFAVSFFRLQQTNRSLHFR
jgi:hypothetical protein